MNKKEMEYYEQYCDDPPFEGKSKEAMLFAFNRCDDFINGIIEDFEIDNEKHSGFYIELADIGEIMNEWLRFHKLKGV